MVHGDDQEIMVLSHGPDGNYLSANFYLHHTFLNWNWARLGSYFSVFGYIII